jgi:hypothetical protein
MRFINLKDWFTWIFYPILIYCIIGYITVNDWVRWKWGYYSLDAIPYVLIIILLGIFENIIERTRMSKRIDELETKLIVCSEDSKQEDKK